jgi:hypothetical protein
MRRTVSAFLTVAVAMLLSVVLAVPASAADIFKDSADPKFKYGLDYWRYYTQGGAGTGGPVSSYPRQKVPVPSSLNPSNTGGSWYLQQQKDAAAGTRVINDANKPLTGKIIEPGKTLVKVPSAYAPRPAYLGNLGMPKLLGSIGIGIGGTADAPANRDEIALGQGVSSACVADAKSCSPAEIKTRFNIDGCAINGNCAAIGAKAADGSDFASWFKTDALPFLADLWESITGQQQPKHIAPDVNGHYNVDPRGCLRYVQEVFYQDGNNANILLGADVKPFSGNWTEPGLYDAACSPDVLKRTATVPTTIVDTVCVDRMGGATGDAKGSFGRSFVLDAQSFEDREAQAGSGHKNLVPLCRADAPSTTRLLSMKFRYAQAYIPGERVPWSTTAYREHHNRVVIDWDTIESTKITTTVDCQTPDGQIFTLSQTIGKTAAVVAPMCPVGSDLIRHDIQSTDGVGTQTIDSGGAVPGAAAKYPECSGGKGCALAVHIDGQACTASRPDCATWPSVAGVTPSRVDCKWGTYSVPVSDCYSLSNGYKSESGVVFDPIAGTWVAIDTYGQPVAPNPEPWNPTNPNPAPGTAPTTGTTPGTGTGTTPGIDTGGFPIKGTNPKTDPNCDAPEWSWNPVEFVKNPVVCALNYAFVPKQDIGVRLGELKDISMTKLPFSWMTPTMVGPGDGGCPNWVVVVPGFSKNVVCDSSFTAAIVASRGPLFGLVAGAMVWPLFRSLWYAAIPVLRVTPSSSK